MNGTTYVFDPNFEYGGYGNGYQINYGMSVRSSISTLPVWINGKP